MSEVGRAGLGWFWRDDDACKGVKLRCDFATRALARGGAAGAVVEGEVIFTHVSYQDKPLGSPCGLSFDFQRRAILLRFHLADPHGLH